MTTAGHSITLKDWSGLGLAEQLANVGAEVGRAIQWQHKQNQQLSLQAFYRSLELLTLCKQTQSGERLTEICRLYEVLVDYFVGENRYGSSEILWQKYFHPFNYLARIDR